MSTPVDPQNPTDAYATGAQDAPEAVEAAQPQGPPLRALAMLLIVAAIGFLGWGIVSLLDGGDDTTTAAGTTSATTTASAISSAASAAPVTTTGQQDATDGATASPSATAAAGDLAALQSGVSVRIYNNSTIQGLGAEVSSAVEESGWTVSEVGNYPSGVIPASTVYFTEGSEAEEQAARAVAEQLGIRVEPRFEGIADFPGGIILIVTGDMQR